MPNNWNNIDLNSHEVDSYLIDPLTFDDLLLEIECGVREINEYTVRSKFEERLQSKVTQARNVFEANLANIVNKALEYRNNGY